MLTVLKIMLLGLIQGAAELLPVSSSAHVVVAEKLMGIDPSSPSAMFLLVMLHTGTMFAMIVYFGSAWKRRYFSTSSRFVSSATQAILATLLTAAIGYPIKWVIEKKFLHGGDIEELARNLPVIAASLLAVGLIILAAGRGRRTTPGDGPAELTTGRAASMGLIQGVSIPFRGFSRSGATISVGMLSGAERRAAEEFSFALAVIITPAVIHHEFARLRQAYPSAVHGGAIAHLVAPGFLGLACSFVAGLAALRWLSHWLEQGKWQYFGYYCVAASAVVFALSAAGY